MKRNDNCLDNKGFSILELLVVIAVGLILIGFTAISLGTANGANLNKAAKGMQNALTQSRVQCMAKGQEAGKIKIWQKDGGGIYCQVGEDGDVVELCNKQISGYFVNINTVDNSVVSKVAIPVATYDTASMWYAFNSAGIVDASNTTITFQGILFEKKNRQTAVIIHWQTGKIEVITIS